MGMVLRLRWLLLLVYGLCVAVLFAVPALFGTSGLIYSWLYGAWFGVACALGCRQRSVTVADEGLWVKRSLINRFFCPWPEVVAVERRQVGPFTVDQLVLREPVRGHVGGKVAGPSVVTWRPVSSKRIFIGLYDRHWKTGPIGAALTARGVSLETTAHTDLAGSRPV
jgi:hypothetical protein